MKKIIKNISAILLCGAMLMSGCSAPVESNFAYPEDYEKKLPVEQMTVIQNEGKGNVGDTELESGDYYAIVEVADFGSIKIKLYPDEAPYAVQNFIDLAQSGYFNGKNIHRVLTDFMIQGGSLNGNGTGGLSAENSDFACEINPNMRHFYGALCYANAAGRNTCQFYIVNNKEPQAMIADVYSQYGEYYNLQAEAYKEYLEQISEGSAEYDYFKGVVDSAIATSNGMTVMGSTLTDEITAKYAEIGGVPFLDGGYTVFGQTVEGFEVLDAISAVETEMGSDGAESKPVEDVIIESVTIMIAE